MSVIVVCPTYNRAHTLARALDSLLAQTDPRWVCHVLDDGSTDGTPELVARYGGDDRIRYHRHAENRGGVAMNEIGMALACDEGDVWTRLGSDDWFGPRKLQLDRLALARFPACFGPYRNEPGNRGSELNVPEHVRPALLDRGFRASWANIAVRTSVLRTIRHRHGRFCDPRLRNMEDHLFNCRLAMVAEIAWRAAAEDGTQAVVGATDPAQVPFRWTHDAHYTIAPDGATYAPELREVVRNDAQITEVCLAEDADQRVETFAPPAPVVLDL